MVCGDCGSNDVERKEWRKINTGKFAGDVSDAEPEDIFCPVCDTHVEIMTQQQYKKLLKNG